MTELVQFAEHNPFTAFCMLWIVGWVLTTPFYQAFRAYNRTLRSRNIAAKGWPTAPVDADGDLVYPKEKD